MFEPNCYGKEKERMNKKTHQKLNVKMIFSKLKFVLHQLQPGTLYNVNYQGGLRQTHNLKRTEKILSLCYSLFHSFAIFFVCSVVGTLNAFQYQRFKQSHPIFHFFITPFARFAMAFRRRVALHYTRNVRLLLPFQLSK